jgi:hypothetical protein
MEKPKNIYIINDNTTTSTTSTRKPIQWDKPEGWDKKPSSNIIKKYKPKWWEILKAGITGDESLEPKYIVKYDNWMHELKVMCLTILSTFAIMYCIFHSPLMSTSVEDQGDEVGIGFLNRGIDYLADKYDEWQGKTVTITPDTVFQVRKDTVTMISNEELMKEVDSIITKYKQDSTALADSLKLNQ